MTSGLCCGAAKDVSVEAVTKLSLAWVCLQVPSRRQAAAHESRRKLKLSTLARPLELGTVRRSWRIPLRVFRKLVRKRRVKSPDLVGENFSIVCSLIMK